MEKVFIPAVWSICPSDIVDQDIESTPLLMNAADYILHTFSRTDIRLHEESNRLPVRLRRARGRCDGGAAQSKTSHPSFSHAVRATGHTNPLALKLSSLNAA